VDYDCVLRFFQARQDFEIILNESSNNIENVHIEWLWKETIKFFTKTKVYVVSLFLSLVFKTVFRIFLAPVVPMLWKTSCSLKTSFWKKNCQKILKWSWKFFSRIFHGFETSWNHEVQRLTEKPFVGEIFHGYFWIYWTIFLPKWCF
jgi:hypothetical protein